MKTQLTTIYLTLAFLTLSITSACAANRPTNPKDAKVLVLRHAAAGSYQKLVDLSKKGKIRFTYVKGKQKTKSDKLKSGAQLKKALGKTPYPKIIEQVSSISVKKKLTKKKKKVRYILKYIAPDGKHGVNFIFKVKKGTLYLKKVKVWDKN